MIRPLVPARDRGGPGAAAGLEVVVLDEQGAHPIDGARWEALALGVLGAEGVRGPAELDLTFVGEADMAELNAAHMGHLGPTDVLAFPIDAPGQDDVVSPDALQTVLLGGIVICPAVAAANAPAHAGTYDDELALLIVHGILHVLGHDHGAPEETRVMQARERNLLDQFHRSDR